MRALRSSQSWFSILQLAFGACLLLLLGACQPIPPVVAARSTPPPLPSALHWFRDSAEQRASYEQTYFAAAQAAQRLSAGLAPGTWGVILDVDETLLDNSEYQRRLAVSGAGFSSASWGAWVHERAATALPGGRRFLHFVHEQLQGRIVLVTNRKAPLCADTEANLQGQGLVYDRILCDEAGNGDKNPRFEAVQRGEPGGPAPLRVLLWVGDNIQDFPALSQANAADLSAFGTRYFVLPNPLYGSWVDTPAR